MCRCMASHFHVWIAPASLSFEGLRLRNFYFWKFDKKKIVNSFQDDGLTRLYKVDV